VDVAVPAFTGLDQEDWNAVRGLSPLIVMDEAFVQ
jgi:hypothetical protein